MTGLYRVRMVSTGWGGAPGLNTWYFKTAITPAAPLSDSEADLCVGRVHDAWSDAAHLYPAQWRGQIDPVVDVLAEETGELVESFGGHTTSALEGDSGAAFAPQATMLVASYRTGTVISGRRVRGRCFLGPVATGGDADGTPTVAMLTVLGSFGASLLSVGILGPDLQVWHRPTAILNEFGNPTGEFNEDGQGCKVTDIVAHDQYAVLRSRRQ